MRSRESRQERHEHRGGGPDQQEDTAAGRARTGTPPAAVLPASRQTRPRWRDTRLILGVLLVVGSVGLGARVVSAADTTVGMLAASGDLAAGTALTAERVTVRTGRLVVEDNPYLTGELPVGYVLTRPVGAGELIPREALAPADTLAPDLRHVVVSVAEDVLPPGLRRGEVVDVWLTPGTQAAPGSGAMSRLVLGGAPVVEVPSTSGAFGVSSGQQPVVLAVFRAGRDEEEFADLLADLVTASSEGRVALVGVPGVAAG